MIKTPIIALGVCTAFLQSASLMVGAELPLEDFAIPQTSYLGTGPGAAGARVALGWVEAGHLSKGALKVDYDFTAGGTSTQWIYSGWLSPQPTALRFYAKGAKGAHVIATLTDSSRQCHQFWFTLSGSEWERFDVPLKGDTEHEHWGGSDDGVIHDPLTALQIGPVSHDKEKGTLFIDEVAVQSEASESELARSRVEFLAKSAGLNVAPSQLAGIFSTKDAKWATLSLDGVPVSVDEVLVHLTCTDANGHSKEGLPKQILLKRSEGFARKLDLQSPIGYYNVSYRLAVRESEIEKEAAPGSFVYAVIPENPVTGKDPKSPFGVCTHFNGWPAEIGKLVKKAGIAWIYNDINTMPDVVVPVARENHLCYLPVFTWYTHPLEQNKDKDGNWDWSDVAAKYRKYAETYGKEIDFYDIGGEPHSKWGAVFGGDWDGGPWQKPYLKFGRQMTQALKQGNPGATILWPDIDVMMWYRQFFDLGAADTIEIVAPHPYNLHRLNPYPEDQPMINQSLPDFYRLVRKHELNWRVWDDEVGFSSFRLAETTPGNLYSPCTELQQAQLLVRLIVLQLVNGVEKIFWYDFRNDGTDPTAPEHNFGLIRYDYTPKPSLVAYANLIDQLRQSRWLGSYHIGGGAFAYAFVDRAKKPKLVAWVKQGSATLGIRVPSNIKQISMTDIFGTTLMGEVTNHQYPLPLSETPIFVEGLTDEDITAFVTKQDVP